MASSKQAVFTTKAVAPLPQFSQAVTYNGMVYCSGNIGIDPATSKLAGDGIKEQTHQAIRNIAAVLEAANSKLENIVKVNVFLTTMDDFVGLNEVYDEFFKGKGVLPCRTCVAVYQLPFGAKMEMEATAFINPEAKL